MTERSLDRFRQAQNQRFAGFATALDEIRSGGKQGHWIWYVFPQLEGLGTSGMSQTYAINGLAEAREYLLDPELGARLTAITEAVAVQARRGVSLRTLMGSQVDALKLVSSLTLFGQVARQLHAEEGRDALGRMADLAEELLAVAEAEGHPPCRFTLARLQESHP
jgi:uncharacterized protein (DUF1810 family)